LTKRERLIRLKQSLEIKKVVLVFVKISFKEVVYDHEEVGYG